MPIMVPYNCNDKQWLPHIGMHSVTIISCLYSQLTIIKTLQGRHFIILSLHMRRGLLNCSRLSYLSYVKDSNTGLRAFEAHSSQLRIQAVYALIKWDFMFTEQMAYDVLFIYCLSKTNVLYL